MNENDMISNVMNDDTTYAGFFDNTEDLKCESYVRKFCEDNACGKYGANWMCPPAVGDIEGCISKIRGYPRFLIFRSEYELKEWYDVERMDATMKLHQENVRRIRDMMKEQTSDFIVLSGGGCMYCKECAYTKKEPCRFPDMALPSIEAYGIDINNFARKKGIKYSSPDGRQYYFGMIFFH